MRYKSAKKITARVSSVTNGFVQAILPARKPCAEDHAIYLAMLEIDPDNLTCAYCGDPAHHWDHLFPFVRSKRPSGYLNEPRNLVPACGPCNTSKSGNDWRTWMFGKAKRSPKSRNIGEIDRLAARLEVFVTSASLQEADLEALVPPDLWASYWNKRDAIEEGLRQAQADAAVIRNIIERALDAKPKL
jgi:hypothetical protein